jgi:hypothetical protein
MVVVVVTMGVAMVVAMHDVGGGVGLVAMKVLV